MSRTARSFAKRQADGGMPCMRCEIMTYTDEEIIKAFDTYADERRRA